MREPTLSAHYRLLAELLLHPRDRDEELVDRIFERAHGPVPVRELLCDFLSREEGWSEDEYVQTIELSAPCPLYAGAYLFDEPTSCRGAGSSGRNGFMIELVNVYRHFGLATSPAELPDYLPLMVDFLRLSLPHAHRDRIGLRTYFVDTCLSPALPPMQAALEKYESPYAKLIAALRLLIDFDPARSANAPRWTPPRTLPHARGGKALPVVGSEHPR